MLKVLTLKGKIGRKYAEPTIGYYDNKLVLLARSGGKLYKNQMGNWKILQAVCRCFFHL